MGITDHQRQQEIDPRILCTGLVLICLLCNAFIACERPSDLDDSTDGIDDLKFDSPTEVSHKPIEDTNHRRFTEEPVVLHHKPKQQLVYFPPVARGNVYFSDALESEADFRQMWVVSRAKTRTKNATSKSVLKYTGKWTVEEPVDNPIRHDLGLVLKSRSKHHAIAAKFKKPFMFTEKAFVIQYEIKFQKGQKCGGAYIKLLSKSKKLNLSQFSDKTPYTIMFGPDKCGSESKLHFIFRHVHPVTGISEEKHAKQPEDSIESYIMDRKTHLYTLVLKSDNSFYIYIDLNLVSSGNLLNDMTPAVNPPQEIIDPEDKKPADWDDQERVPARNDKKPPDWNEKEPEKIADENATKPEGWLEDVPEYIQDTEAQKPMEWKEELNGQWAPTMIKNPRCRSVPGCGPWKVPLIDNPKYRRNWSTTVIDNPNYRGKWFPRTIPNPEYFEDLQPFKRMAPIAAIGIELWSVSSDILFDNFFVSDSKRSAERWAAESWEVKRKWETYKSGQEGVVMQFLQQITDERPWLWAVTLLVVILPITLLIVCCCETTSKRPESEDTNPYSYKKTDEPTADDYEEFERNSNEDLELISNIERIRQENLDVKERRNIEDDHSENLERKQRNKGTHLDCRVTVELRRSVGNRTRVNLGINATVNESEGENISLEDINDE